MKHFLVFALTLTALFFSQEAIGQCCSAGNPVGGDGSTDVLIKNSLRVYIFYKYSLSTDYYHLDSHINVPSKQKSYYNYGNVSLTYGLSSKLSLHTELGYFIDKAQELSINQTSESINAHGLGDLALNMRYIVHKSGWPITQFVVSIGAKIPIGAFQEEIDGITVPISIQPSSGAFKYNASIFYTRKQNFHRFGWYGFMLFELSQQIDKAYLVYTYGNYFQFSLAGTYSLTQKLEFIANAKFEWRSKDKRESDNKIESTGSSAICFNPQLVYNLRNKWGIIGSSDIPVYKYVNGYQLTNKFAIQFGLRKNISLADEVTKLF